MPDDLAPVFQKPAAPYDPRGRLDPAGFARHVQFRTVPPSPALAPFIEQAMARKPWMRPLADDEIPELLALGRQVAQQVPELQGTATDGSSASGFTVPLSDPLANSR